MRKINSVLGIYPTRVSRVSAINSANQSLESVVFQQGKSLLDYDLNVMQDIASKNVQRLTQSLYRTSGFLTSINVPTSSTSSSISLNSCYVNILGHIFQVASTGNGAPNLVVNLPNHAKSFMWIEAWYQEIVPTSASGETINSVSTESKDAKLYKYGNAGSSVLTANELSDNLILDNTFAAETTRRIQLRWRIRIDALSSATDPITSIGFYSSLTTDSTDVSNSLIKAYGGRTSSYATTSPYTFWRANSISVSNATYGSLAEIADSTKYKADMRDSFSEFLSYQDSGLYVAGRGTDDDAQELNTVDGRVYGIPIAIISYTAAVGNASPTWTLLSKTTQIATSTDSSVTIGEATAPQLKIRAIDPDISNNASISVVVGESGATNTKKDLYISSLDYGGYISYVVPKRLSVLEQGTFTNPSISFELTTRNSGFYTNRSNTLTKVGVSVSAKEIATFYNNTSDSATFGLNIAGLLNVDGATTFAGNVTSTGGIFTANSTTLTNILPRLTSNTLFSSSNVLVTGGSISGTSVSLKAGSTPIASGDIQWDNSTTTLKVGSSNTATISFGYLGSTISTAVSGSAAQTALAGTSNEVARADHRHANPSTYSPSSHVSQHVSGGSDPFGPVLVNGVSTNVNLNAVAKVGVSISTVSSGQATSTVGTIFQRRQINFVAGANTTLGLSEDGTTETASLTISANVAGFQDVWTNTTTLATAMTANKYYTVVTVGTTSVAQWQAVGAPASVTVGTVFLASGAAASGDGTVRPTFNSLPSAPGDVGSYAWIPVSYMVATNSYVIMSLGNTNFTLLGASANTIGLTFIANTIVPTGTGMVMPLYTQQYAAHREHTHPRLDGYSTGFSTLPISGTGTAGTSTDLSRGDHQHSWPLYLTAKFGFGATPTSIASALDVYGTSTYTTMASSLFVRDGAAFAADVGGRIALGGAVNGTTFTAYAGISGRKSVATVDNYAGYLSLWVNAGSSTTLTEFFRGYDNGSIYVGTTGQTKPTDADSMVVKGKITAAGFVVTGGAGISAGSGGTGTTSYAVGDILYADTTTTLAKLTKPASATSLLTMTSAGVPAWASLANTGITGVGTITTGAWNGTVGATTANTGAFTTISASSTTASSSTTTGALVVGGGVGVAGTITAGGFAGPHNGTVGATTASTGAFTTISASSTTASSSTTTGALVVSGGVGVAGTITAAGFTGPVGATSPSTGAFTTLTANGQLVLTVTTAASSKTTGALTVAGGLGVSGAVYADSAVLTATTASTSTATGALIVSGGVGVSGTITAAGFTGPVGATSASTGAFTTISASSTTASSSTTTGALVVSGGVGVAGTITAAGFTGPHNGTVGATTASTGAFSTISASGTITSTSGGSAISAAGEFTTTGANGLRIGTLMLRNDGSNTYFLFGTSGTSGDNWSTMRPLTINNATGNISTSGAVSGGFASRCIIPTASFIPAVTNGASLGYLNTGIDKYELQYSGGDDSGKLAYVTLSVPYNYAGGTITIRVYWYIASGTNSQVRWEALASFVAINGAVNSTPAQVASADAGVATGAVANTLIISTLTWSTSLPAAGSLLYFGLKRNTTSASDTSTAVACVQSVAIEFGS